MPDPRREHPRGRRRIQAAAHAPLTSSASSPPTATASFSVRTASGGQTHNTATLFPAAPAAALPPQVRGDRSRRGASRVLKHGAPVYGSTRSPVVSGTCSTRRRSARPFLLLSHTKRLQRRAGNSSPPRQTSHRCRGTHHSRDLNHPVCSRTGPGSGSRKTHVVLAPPEDEERGPRLQATTDPYEYLPQVTSFKLQPAATYRTGSSWLNSRSSSIFGADGQDICPRLAWRRGARVDSLLCSASWGPAPRPRAASGTGPSQTYLRIVTDLPCSAGDDRREQLPSSAFQLRNNRGMAGYSSSSPTDRSRHTPLLLRRACR